MYYFKNNYVAELRPLISNLQILSKNYLAINSIKNVVAIDYKGNKHNVTLGEISADNDLAYLYIDVKGISFAKLSITSPTLADDIYILNSDDLLLKGIVSKVEKNSVIINVEISKGTSGAGIFSTSNELIAIAISKDILNKTTYATTAFNTITDKYITKVKLQDLNSNNYDYSHCENKADLVIWNKHATSNDLNVQEFHALFLGLCEKVKNKNLTTEEANFIFESARVRLFGSKL